MPPNWAKRIFSCHFGKNHYYYYYYYYYYKKDAWRGGFLSVLYTDMTVSSSLLQKENKSLHLTIALYYLHIVLSMATKHNFLPFYVGSPDCKMLQNWVCSMGHSSTESPFCNLYPFSCIEHLKFLFLNICFIDIDTEAFSLNDSLYTYFIFLAFILADLCYLSFCKFMYFNHLFIISI